MESLRRKGMSGGFTKSIKGGKLTRRCLFFFRLHVGIRDFAYIVSVISTKG